MVSSLAAVESGCLCTTGCPRWEKLDRCFQSGLIIDKGMNFLHPSSWEFHMIFLGKQETRDSASVAYLPAILESAHTALRKSIGREVGMMVERISKKGKLPSPITHRPSYENAVTPSTCASQCVCSIPFLIFPWLRCSWYFASA